MYTPHKTKAKIFFKKIGYKKMLCLSCLCVNLYMYLKATIAIFCDFFDGKNKK